MAVCVPTPTSTLFASFTIVTPRVVTVPVTVPVVVDPNIVYVTTVALGQPVCTPTVISGALTTACTTIPTRLVVSTATGATSFVTSNNVVTTTETIVNTSPTATLFASCTTASTIPLVSSIPVVSSTSLPSASLISSLNPLLSLPTSSFSVSITVPSLSSTSNAPTTSRATSTSASSQSSSASSISSTVVSAGDSGGGGSSAPVGAIVGGVVGAVAALLVVLLLFCLWSRGRNKGSDSASDYWAAAAVNQKGGGGKGGSRRSYGRGGGGGGGGGSDTAIGAWAAGAAAATSPRLSRNRSNRTGGEGYPESPKSGADVGGPGYFPSAKDNPNAFYNGAPSLPPSGRRSMRSTTTAGVAGIGAGGVGRNPSHGSRNSRGAPPGVSRNGSIPNGPPMAMVNQNAPGSGAVGPHLQARRSQRRFSFDSMATNQAGPEGPAGGFGPAPSSGFPAPALGANSGLIVPASRRPPSIATAHSIPRLGALQSFNGVRESNSGPLRVTNNENASDGGGSMRDGYFGFNQGGGGGPLGPVQEDETLRSDAGSFYGGAGVGAGASGNVGGRFDGVGTGPSGDGYGGLTAGLLAGRDAGPPRGGPPSYTTNVRRDDEGWI